MSRSPKCAAKSAGDHWFASRAFKFALAFTNVEESFDMEACPQTSRERMRAVTSTRTRTTFAKPWRWAMRSGGIPVLPCSRGQSVQSMIRYWFSVHVCAQDPNRYYILIHSFSLIHTNPPRPDKRATVTFRRVFGHWAP